MLDKLQGDMLKLIDLSNEMGKYNERLLFLLNMLDKENYNTQQAENIRKKLIQLNLKFDAIKSKWF